MDNSAIKDCQIRAAQKLIDAMRILDSRGTGIVLVVDDGGRLLGVMTDGDIRRALLKGATLDALIGPYISQEFIAVGPETSRAEVLDLMQAHLLRQIPIVSREGVLVGLHLLHEIIGAVERPNRAVIMAGGKGMRLRPFTDHIPKPMLKVAGRPIMERILLHLIGYGIRHVYLSVSYLGHIIEEYFGDGSKLGCKIEYLRELESEPLGTGGALSLLPEEPKAPLLILNGDLVTQADLGQMISTHVLGGYVATMGVRRYSHEIPFGCVEISNKCITGLDEKPSITRMINAGVYVLSPAVVRRVPRKFFPITDLFESCIEKGEAIGAFEIEDEWLDVGRHDQLKGAREGHA